MIALCVALLLQAPAPEPAPIVPPALLAPLELPTALPARRDIPVQVQVQVTVETDGRLTDLAIAPNDRSSPALRAIALEALKNARLSPATQGGKPLRVRIDVPIVLGRTTHLTELKLDLADPNDPSDPNALGPSGLARQLPEATPTIAAGVSGVVLERGTRRPVAGVAVTLGTREVLTDEDGRFTFPDVPRGRATIEVPFFAEDSARATVNVPGNVTLRVTPDRLREYRTRVSAPTQSVSDASRIIVPVERAREIPGSQGDPIKVLESLPGLARPAAAGPGAGELAVRGSGPGDSKFYVDGLPLFQLYHFGNIYSVLQDEWVGEIDFRAGGYSTEYGDATGGMVNVTLADMRRDGVHGHGDVNVYHVAGLVTVPVNDDWTLGAAVRRSWVDAILTGVLGGEDSSVDLTSAPRYYDYQLRADHHPGGGKTRLKLLAFGSDDEIIVVGRTPDANDPNGSGFAFERSFHQIQGTANFDLDAETQLTLGLATSYQQLRVSPGSNDLRITFDPVTLRADLEHRPSKSLRLRGGLWADLTRFKVELAVPRPTKEGEVQLPSEVQERIEATEEGFGGRLDAWGEAIWRTTDALTLSGGTRLASWHGNFAAFAPDLRLAASYELADPTRVTLTAGLNHQAPTPDESAETIGNTELLPERSFYVNLGFTQQLGELVSVELQGFAKSLDQLVVTTDRGADVPYDNAGTGTVLGAEALIRLQHPVVDAWIAYTLSRSRRIDRPGEPERFFSFDQTHVLALVAGVQLGAGWRFGTRLRYSTGNPFTPLEPAYYDAGADVWVPPASGDLLSGRAEAFFQLDLRIDKTWLFDTWKLDLYFELSNATNRRNIEAIGYSDDFRERDDIQSLPIIPGLGLRGSF